MYQSEAWVYSSVLASCLCWSSILVVAQNSITDPVEVSALREIKKSLIDPNKNLSNWNRGDPCTANWTGVYCYSSTLEDGYLHVQDLQLLNMNLSGTLSPQLGRLSHMQILDFMWNDLTGSIPKEIGNISSLQLLILNGNKLSGSLPEELGNIENLFSIQIDENQISGPIPKSFAKLNKTMHFHMNNNSISGQIPPELSRLPSLVHFLLDNNNLSGHLPPEFSELPELLILQVDNNNFSGTTIPESYGNMSKLLKLSLRNCGLRGPIPDLSRIPKLGYLDLSSNQLSGPIPPDKLSHEIKTIDLSNNELTGNIPSSFSELPQLQKLSVANNSLNGSVSSSIWTDRTLNSTESLKLEFQNNRLNSIVGNTNIPPNVTVWLQGNPVCDKDNTSQVQFCGPQNEDRTNGTGSPNSNVNCPAPRCPSPYEYSKTSIVKCFCAIPLIVEYRLKSPGFSDFVPYIRDFERYLSSGLHVHQYQLEIVTFQWEKGPRIRMTLKLFPEYVPNTSYTFNTSEVRRIVNIFTRFRILNDDLFGPYDPCKFTLLGPYANVFVAISGKSGVSKGVLVGEILGGIAGATILTAIISLLILRMRMKRNYQAISKKRRLSRIPLQINGVKDFSYQEMASATNDFDSSVVVGQGGYGKVYKGILADGVVVAIKRAQEGSLQGEKEFLMEIELLSRLHHRNLVSLIGFCDEEGEQMLVYEFMPNGTLRDQLSAKSKEPLTFALRMRIALGSAKGILYLHTEANPPIFHRDIKASNILLDSKFTVKVADFGLSRLARVPEIEGNMPAHVSTIVKGTPGYLDPAYILTHKLTDKSDVYSLGIVFLELLTGMHPITHGKNIVREVNMAFQSGTIFSVIDERMGSYPSHSVEKFLTLALWCCQDDIDSRPSMVEVVRQLENIWIMMPESVTKMTEELTTPKDGKGVTPPSSSSEVKHPDLSLDVSSSNLVSGVIPTIVPR